MDMTKITGRGMAVLNTRKKLNLPPERVITVAQAIEAFNHIVAYRQAARTDLEAALNNPAKAEALKVSARRFSDAADLWETVHKNWLWSQLAQQHKVSLPCSA